MAINEEHIKNLRYSTLIEFDYKDAEGSIKIQEDKFLLKIGSNRCWFSIGGTISKGESGKPRIDWNGHPTEFAMKATDAVIGYMVEQGYLVLER